MSEELHRHRHARRGRRVPRFIQAYWVEIVIVLGLALSVFLIFEQLNIRGTLLGWAWAALSAGATFAEGFAAALVRFVSRIGLSELIAIPLLFGICILMVWRVRWRLQRVSGLTDLRCPRCGSSIHRAHRHFFDHVISIVVPVRRYHCAARDCRWSGLRVSIDVHRGRSWSSPG